MGGAVFCHTLSGKPVHILTYADFSSGVDQKSAIHIHGFFRAISEINRFFPLIRSPANEQLPGINNKTDCLW